MLIRILVQDMYKDCYQNQEKLYSLKLFTSFVDTTNFSKTTTGSKTRPHAVVVMTITYQFTTLPVYIVMIYCKKLINYITYFFLHSNVAGFY